MPAACYTCFMSAVQIKNIPADLHAAVRRRAAEEGLTISDYMLALIRRDLTVPSQNRWLADLSTRAPVERVDILASLDATRAAREEELAGP